MLSTALKRTAATLGVLAGLLAAAAPASAQIGPATIAIHAGGGWDPTPVRSVALAVEPRNVRGLFDPSGFTVEVGMGMSEDFLNASQPGAANDVPQLSATAGTQIGSEG